MNTQQTVLLVGGTGRTGQRVLQQILSRGINVRVIVRSAQKLPTGAAETPNLTVVEADLLSLSNEELQRYIRGCDAVISCLGHVISFKGVFGPPRDLVVRATTRLCRKIEALQPVKPVKFILMSSVSVNHPGGLDARRGMFEKAVLWILRRMVPPAEDNQLAANFLYSSIGMTNPFVQWVAVRPDSLLEGDVSEYTLHEGLVSSLFAPDSTNMANVAHFMCELFANPKAWNDWKGKLPVIINATPSKR
ncbi:MAG: SDR family oxidoreductase [Proteobacteria bacterium]|nr:SDR family oxidoreductase [Pseudomonadota bacterium]